MKDKRAYKVLVATLVAVPLAVDFVMPTLAKANEDGGRFMWSILHFLGLK